MQDFGKLLLRVVVSVLILFHGVDKIIHGVAWIEAPLAALHLPAWIAWGVYAGEVAAPLFLLLGIGARAAAIVIVVNMVMAVVLDAHVNAFGIGTGGAWGLEREAFYFFTAAASAFLGPGRFRVFLGGRPAGSASADASSSPVAH